MVYWTSVWESVWVDAYGLFMGELDRIEWANERTGKTTAITITTAARATAVCVRKQDKLEAVSSKSGNSIFTQRNTGCCHQEPLFRRRSQQALQHKNLTGKRASSQAGRRDHFADAHEKRDDNATAPKVPWRRRKVDIGNTTALPYISRSVFLLASLLNPPCFIGLLGGPLLGGRLMHHQEEMLEHSFFTFLTVTIITTAVVKTKQLHDG